MSEERKVFTGKEVTDAIKKACEELSVPQERLDIEVMETGSSGIFGLIRKKARISVLVKEEVEEVEEPVASKDVRSSSAPERKERGRKTTKDSYPKRENKRDDAPLADVSQESVVLVKEELLELLAKMDFPSSVEATSKGNEINCKITGDYEEYLTGQEGKTLDSIQYLLRKIVARKTPERIKLSVDVGDFREKRKESLKIRAVELAELVKTDGKTQVIPALNPSERRVVHMTLQDDREIRSRSVGDGLFKKILIYKPGKGNKGDGRKRHYNKNNRGRRPKNNSNSSDK